MIPFKAFEVLIGIISGARERERQEHEDFLGFYNSLVRIIPSDIAKDFGSIEAPVKSKSTSKNYRIELNVTDYLWWTNVIQNDKARFITSPAAIQRDIWEKLNTLVKREELSQEVKDQLMNILGEEHQQVG